MSMNPNPSIPRLSPKDHLSDYKAQFSKWLSLEFLIDKVEMNSLFSSLAPFFLLPTQRILNNQSDFVTLKEFLDFYGNYIDCLKSGIQPPLKEIKEKCYLFLVRELEGISLKPVNEAKGVFLFNNSFIEIKPICLSVSKVDASIRSTPINPHDILWGLKLSIPQIIQKASSNDIQPINLQKDPQGVIFKSLRKWLREHTKPTPMILGSKVINSSIRLGKNCFSWINQHPGLKRCNLKIAL